MEDNVYAIVDLDSGEWKFVTPTYNPILFPASGPSQCYCCVNKTTGALSFDAPCVSEDSRRRVRCCAPPLGAPTAAATSAPRDTSTVQRPARSPVARRKEVVAEMALK